MTDLSAPVSAAPAWAAPASSGATYRSLLFVPGSETRFHARGAASAADAVCLDLEDSVAPADKERARANVVRALRELDWGGKRVICRINGLDTPWWYRDVMELCEQGGDRLDAIMLPKVNSGADIHVADMLAVQASRNGGRRAPPALEAQIETAAALVHLDGIPSGSPRLAALHFGAADFAVSMGMPSIGIGADAPDYVTMSPDAAGQQARLVNDIWHYPLMRIIAAARAHGLLPVDGPYGNFTDHEGLAVHARRSAAMGCGGKWAIHPGQIGAINAAFTPGPAEIERARRVLDALAQAQEAGRGAAALDGVLLDRVTIRQAEQVLARARD